MNRNMEVKKNVDDMLLQIFKYIKAAGVKEDEYSILAAELAASCLVTVASFETKNKKEIADAKRKIQLVNSMIMNDILENLEVYINVEDRCIDIEES